MKKQILSIIVILIIMMTACNMGQQKKNTEETGEKIDHFQYLLEQFADLKIMRYQVPEFDELSLEQKKLVYYLSEAARCGRDIMFDQNYKHNLKIRKTLEEIYKNYKGDRANRGFPEFCCVPEKSLVFKWDSPPLFN